MSISVFLSTLTLVLLEFILITTTTQKNHLHECRRRGYTLLYYYVTFLNLLSFMSLEFAPQAPAVVAETISEGKIVALESKLDGKLLKKHTIAQDVYRVYGETADTIDDREGTNVPFRRNAVHVASLLAVACIRGAQIS